MACPTCGKPMHPTNATRGEWCEQCGTMTNGEQVFVPTLIGRCRAFAGGLIRQPRPVHTASEIFNGLVTVWKSLGIPEAIGNNVTEDRPR